eukprot:gene10318-21535_t
MPFLPESSCSITLIPYALRAFKDEDLVIEEFLDHYIWQGVQHFYIIDNNSSDNTLLRLQQYNSTGMISYYFIPEQFSQVENYQIVFKSHAKTETKWLIVVDVDEYIYHRNGLSILEYINKLNASYITHIRLNWRNFGSSNHTIQPRCIRTSFTWRAAAYGLPTKVIVSTQRTIELNVHDAEYTKPVRQRRNPPFLALNHYIIMSSDYYHNVKMKRGNIAYSKFNYRTSYFDRFNSFDVEDEVLKYLVWNANTSQRCHNDNYSKSPSLIKSIKDPEMICKDEYNFCKHVNKPKSIK